VASAKTTTPTPNLQDLEASVRPTITLLQVSNLFQTIGMVDGSGADWNAQKALELPILVVDLAKPITLLVVFLEAAITPQQAASARRPVRKFCQYAPLSSATEGTMGEK
jgi:hypothetical protein